MPDSPETLPPALPAGTVPPASAEPGVPAHLEGLAETARNYARGAKAANTRRAYAARAILPPGAGVRTSMPCPRTRR
jgi:hypothetical protein